MDRENFRVGRHALPSFVGLALVALLFAWVGPTPLYQVRDAEPRLLAIVGLLVFVELAMRIARWVLLYHGAPRWAGIGIYLVGLAINTIGTPGVSETARAAVAQRRLRVPAERTLVASGLERLYDLLILVAIAILALPLLGLENRPWNLLVPVACLVIGMGILARPNVMELAANRLGIKKRWRAILGNLLRRTAADLRTALQHPLSLFGALLLSVSLWMIRTVAHWAFLEGLGANVTIIGFAGAMAVSLVAGGLLMTPGGLGVRETTFAILLVSQGVAFDTAVAGAVLFRLFVDGGCILMGASAMTALWKRSTNRPSVAVPSSLGSNE